MYRRKSTRAQLNLEAGDCYMRNAFTMSSAILVHDTFQSLFASAGHVDVCAIRGLDINA